jgi:hypothetical protein
MSSSDVAEVLPRVFPPARRFDRVLQGGGDDDAESNDNPR